MDKYTIFKNDVEINTILAEEDFIIANFSGEGFSYKKIETPSSIRNRRNDLLNETDWWAVSDRVMSAEEITYRQELRDLPQQPGFPNDVVWPVKPI